MKYFLFFINSEYKDYHNKTYLHEKYMALPKNEDKNEVEQLITVVNKVKFELEHQYAANKNTIKIKECKLLTEYLEIPSSDKIELS